MTKPSFTHDAIRLRGVRHNNLKNFDLDLPIGKLTVITGLSGSGKSSLAFDTLFAEGQRRYIETFSPYARQFFDRMDKPQVDRIEGIPPAIAIEQRNSVRSTRSTVGTMTELCDYMKLLWPHVAKLHCKQCGQPVRKESPQLVWERIRQKSGVAGDETGADAPEVLVTFILPLSEKLPFSESLGLVARQGYQRLLLGSEIIRLEDASVKFGLKAPPALVVVQDRLKVAEPNRARFTEACEQAYHFGKGRLTVHILKRAATPLAFVIQQSSLFSRDFHCAACDIDYREPSPALFSFNHPVGACPSCKGFGRIISIDYNLALPDRSKTLAGGAVKPWQTGMSADCQRDLMKFCRASDIATDVPFEKLSQRTQDWVIEGDTDYDTADPEHSWPRAWYGVKGYFRWLESKSYKMHVRVLLSRYRAYTLCPECGGQRLKPEALLYRLELVDKKDAAPRADVSSPSLSLADFYSMSIERALKLIEQLAQSHSLKSNDPLGLALNEVRARLRYLVEVGLGYLTLDRPTRTLSGGETERVNLTACLGTRLVNTLFILDEPSVGLHARDTARLVHILEQLRDTGNTVVVVEHESSVMRAADHIVDLGPGQGEKGGHIEFNGSLKDLLASKTSLTGQYLSGQKRIEIPSRRPTMAGQGAGTPRRLDRGIIDDVPSMKDATVPFGRSREVDPVLRIHNATRHNLKNVTVEIPLGRFVALTGVS
ncbi:MAG: excinuclease subunit, partial [Verrucomicrobiota bacterium]